MPDERRISFALLTNRVVTVALATVVGLTAGLGPGAGSPAAAQRPVASETEPNDDRQNATPVSGAFEIAGDATGTDDWFSWAVGDDDGAWTLEIESPTDQNVALTLFDRDRTLDGARSRGAAAVRDLVLPAGDYAIRVAYGGSEPLPYTLRARLQAEPFDPEPNDAFDPVPIGDGVSVVGRLGRTGSDEDRYLLEVPAGSDVLRDITLTWPSAARRTLCLLNDEGRQRVCHDGDDGAADILDLALEPGVHTISVSGASEPDAPYTLGVEAARPPSADYETEPNDTPESAARLDLATGISGRGSFQDPEFFRATVDGETQLWRVVASGAGVQRLSWVLPAGDELVFGRPAGEGEDAILADLLLAPGDHYFRLYSDEPAAYTINAIPLGAPDDEAEREPNSDVDRAEPYAIGQRRVGRLETADDQDNYRFTAAARERVHLRLEQPADADLQLVVQYRDGYILQTRSAAPGAAIDYDLLLQPGDYLIRITPYGPSEEPYELTTERLDPFDVSVDQEPNGQLATAQAVPPSLRWTGDAEIGNDEDWYVLPPLMEPGPLIIRVEPDAQATVRVSDGSEDRTSELESVADEQDATRWPDPPTGVPLYVLVRARTLGPYEASVEAPGLQPGTDPVDPPLTIEMSSASREVAAYWPQQQRVDAVLEIGNEGTADLAIELDAVTSHEAWSVEPAQPSVEVPAGATVEVPLSIHVRPDVWAGQPVRVSVAAIAPDGGLVSTGLDFEARPDAVPVDPGSPFSVPEPLLGGLNVAGLGLGASPVDPNQTPVHDEEMLFDDVTPDGNGTWVKPAPLPVEFVVDLAGDAAVPIVGTILNVQAQAYPMRDMPAGFELLLSTDGASWEQALSGELSPLPGEQSFVLDAPVQATHAMLRITSTHGDAPRSTTLGEWKVIAQPGAVPDPMPTDLADPVRGGHVVTFAPFFDRLEWGPGMLDSDLARREVTVREGDDRFEIILGFKDGRAARLTSLGWSDPDGSVPDARVERVDVELSLEGPLGPWQSAGEWVLEREADGSVAPFRFDEPVWARYVRLVAPLTLEPPERQELPADIDAHEAPTTDDYRSVLGEWGYTSSQGPYEWSTIPLDPAPVTLDPDAGDSADAATALELGSSVTDSVEAAADVDWYAVEIPAGVPTLEVELGGVDARRVRLALFDGDAVSVPISAAPASGSGARYRAAVEPGTRYLLRVEQPPLSTVIAFDTSDSMVPYMPFVRGALRAFTDQIVPGLDAVMLLPFEEPPLLPTWQDQPAVLRDALDNHVRTNRSSGAEASLIKAAELLADRDTERAILLLTDAETSSYGSTPELWPQLAAVEPVIFGVNLGAKSNPARARDLMQGWVAGNGGHYVYASTHAAVDRAFERMTTWLRRPAIYTLSAEVSGEVLQPPQLEVVSPPDAPVALAPDVGIGIILDTSGSMRKKLDGTRRIAIAKASMRELLGETLVEGTPLSIRTLGPGGKRWKCRSRLEVPLAPLDRDAALGWVQEVRAPRKAGTPLTDALEQVPGDLEGVGERVVVVITDGNESCGGDPDAAIAGLREQGIETTVNIVGFALDDEALKAAMAGWAATGNGSYFDATSADELAAAVRTAVSAPFEVYRPDTDEPVARGIVGGDAVSLEPGRYRVEVISDPVVSFDVELDWDQSVALELPATRAD